MVLYSIFQTIKLFEEYMSQKDLLNKIYNVVMPHFTWDVYACHITFTIFSYYIFVLWVLRIKVNAMLKLLN